MPKLLFSLLLLFLFVELSAQIDTIFYSGNKSKVRWITDCTDMKHCQLTAYRYDGQLMSRAIIDKSKSGFRPSGDAVIYNKQGKVYQEYNYEEGILKTYAPNGILKKKLIVPVKDTIHYHYTYYESGKVQMETVKPSRVGEQPLAYSHSRRNGEYQDLIYANTGYTMDYERHYYPNGNLLLNHYRDKAIKQLTYKKLYYNPDGSLDTTTYETRTRGYKWKKTGTFRAYHANGQLRQIQHYKDGQKDGKEENWFDNGKLSTIFHFKKDKLDGKQQWWWKNGQLKEMVYYQYGSRHGPHLEWHKNGTVQRQGSYYLGSPVGFYNWTDTMGTMRFQGWGGISRQASHSYRNPRDFRDYTYWISGKGEFKNGLRDGDWIFWYSHKGKAKTPIKEKCMEISFKNGLIDGDFKLWHPNGKKWVKTTFTEGFLDGEYVEYAEAGYKVTEGKMVRHQRRGYWTIYHRNKKKYRITNFTEGKQETIEEWTEEGKPRILTKYLNNGVKETEYYNKAGVFYAKSVLPKGRITADYYAYDKEGNLERKKIHESDEVRAYREVHYYKSGAKKAEGNYVKGRRQGWYLTWYEGGQKKSETYFDQGRRDGKQFGWKEDGTPFAIREYRKGKEIFKTTAEELNLSCRCPESKEEGRRHQFMPSFQSYVGLNRINDLNDVFTLREEVYKRIFVKYRSMDRGYFSLELHSFGNVILDLPQRLQLNLTACRRGTNLGILNINGHHSFDRRVSSVIDEDEPFEPTPFNYFKLMGDLRYLEWEGYIKMAALSYQKPTRRWLAKEYGLDDALNDTIKTETIYDLMTPLIPGFEDMNSSQLDSFETAFIKELYDRIVAPNLEKQSTAQVFNRFFDQNTRSYKYQYANLPQLLKGKLNVRIGEAEASLLFPKTLLQPYDTAQKKLVDMDNELYQQSALRFTLDRMSYNNRARKNLQWQLKRSTNFCFEPSELTGTGIVFASNKFSMNLVNVPQRSSVPIRNCYPAHQRYTTTNQKSKVQPYKNDLFLRQFIGVYSQDGTVQIELDDKIIEGIARHWLINGQEINGIIEIPKNASSMNEAKWKEILKAKGLDIFSTPQTQQNIYPRQRPEVWWFYFRYKGKEGN